MSFWKEVFRPKVSPKQAFDPNKRAQDEAVGSTTDPSLFFTYISNGNLEKVKAALKANQH